MTRNKRLQIDIAGLETEIEQAKPGDIAYQSLTLTGKAKTLLLERLAQIKAEQSELGTQVTLRE
jgi:hypothetical protein